MTDRPDREDAPQRPDPPNRPEREDAGARERYVEAVLRRVEAIPPGSVSTYSRIAEDVGRGGPRQVGRVLAQYGGAVPWWRVVRADGSLPLSHQRAALEHYAAEATPLLTKSDGPRVDLATALCELSGDCD